MRGLSIRLWSVEDFLSGALYAYKWDTRGELVNHLVWVLSAGTLLITLENGLRMMLVISKGSDRSGQSQPPINSTTIGDEYKDLSSIINKLHIFGSCIFSHI